MDVSENSGTPKSSILKKFSIIDHPFWGTPIFGNIQMGFNQLAGVVGTDFCLVKTATKSSRMDVERLFSESCSKKLW